MIEPMKTYRFISPADNTIRAGQTVFPKGLQFFENGTHIILPWGSPVEVREQCRYPFGYSQKEKKYLVHIDFATEHKNLFSPINKL